MMLGGDTASALAAGCPVVVEAHSSHPGDVTAVLQRDGGLVHPRCRTVLHRARPGLRARRPRRRPAGRCDGRAVRGTGAQVLLNEGIAASYGRISDGLAAAPGVEEVARGGEPSGRGFEAVPRLLATAAGDLPHEVTEECFGPVSVVARYDGEKELFAALDAMPSSLTATVLRGAGETELPLAVSQELRTRAGRLVYDAYPTGVAVSWAQHHGGPWPSTNSQHTSVGTTAIRRFLRPVTWQGAPQEVLTEELTDGYRGIPRRLDGVLQMPRGVVGSPSSASSAACGSTRTSRSPRRRCRRPGSPSTACAGTTRRSTGPGTTWPSCAPAGTTPGGGRSSWPGPTPSRGCATTPPCCAGTPTRPTCATSRPPGCRSCPPSGTRRARRTCATRRSGWSSRRCPRGPGTPRAGPTPATSWRTSRT